MKKIKDYLKDVFYLILANSVREAASEQRLNDLVRRLGEIKPDISDQYSTFRLNSEYLRAKARRMHAFQISLVNRVIGEFETPVIVDIGDSCGTHLQYIIGLHSKDKDIKCISVNMDAKAVEKIKAKGLDAIKSRAEDLQNYNINADIFLCFEMLEHLMDPCKFLYQLSSKTNAKYLVATVPYLRYSRVGLNHIRKNFYENRYAENTHIFELSPEDWKLIFKHSGWKAVEEKIYLQYSKKRLSRITKPLWRKFDFEGFYGVILKRDNIYSSKYKDW